MWRSATRPHRVPAQEWSRLAGEHRPAQHREGFLSATALEYYKWTTLNLNYPRVPVIPGERGESALGYCTHVEIGTARCPETGRVDNGIVCTPWGVGKLRATGKLTPMAGWWMSSPPPHWREQQEDSKNPHPLLRLYGDWSSVSGHKGCTALWGMGLRQKTLAVNTSAPKLPVGTSGLMLHPHYTGVEWYLADSGNDRILKMKMSTESHDIEPTMSDFMVGLRDPFDAVCYSGRDTLIVSERQANRIVECDMDGNIIDVLVEGREGLATIQSARMVSRRASLSVIQAEDCVLPDGLYIHTDDEGEDWCYFGSAAMRQIKRVNLKTKDVEVKITDVPSKGHFIKLAVSDGTAYPKGTMFASTWIKTYNGAPIGWLDDGTQFTVTQSAKGINGGRGATGSPVQYSCACGVGQGRLVYGGSVEGIVELSLGHPSDETIDRSRFDRGQEQFKAMGGSLVYGHSACGFYGLPLPYGQNDDLDYYLDWVTAH